MDALLSLIPGGLVTTLVASISAVLLVIWRAFATGRASGRNEERARTSAERSESVEERLEMHREATEAERRAAGTTDEEARKEALKWAKPR
ncbi:hypothetical protein [Chelativorans sp. AA-79]|uniref:hypothetical protein n=1 Tax=Chelativorans sp. AA-79 TaxID=3028735 RepID=UPI0023F6A2F5|nr:hypothetical protein [Chelativorans sp. AA-79]WEX07360.1 hypothetical protein PVE73_14640 [Chelativorans sp. AA-79]